MFEIGAHLLGKAVDTVLDGDLDAGDVLIGKKNEIEISETSPKD